jgi:hypothetical protein
MFEIPEEIKEEVYVAAGKATTDISGRHSGGDVFAGAIAAGADNDTAISIALSVHDDPELRRESSLLLIGATQFLKQRGEADG